MSKKVSIIGGVLGGLFSLVPEAGRQITGGGGKSKKGGSDTHNHYHITTKVGNTFKATKHNHFAFKSSQDWHKHFYGGKHTHKGRY